MRKLVKKNIIKSVKNTFPHIKEGKWCLSPLVVLFLILLPISSEPINHVGQRKDKKLYCASLGLRLSLVNFIF